MQNITPCPRKRANFARGWEGRKDREKERVKLREQAEGKITKSVCTSLTEEKEIVKKEWKREPKTKQSSLPVMSIKWVVEPSSPQSI